MEDNENNTTIKNTTNIIKKIKIGILNPISNEWFNLHSDILDISKNVSDVDYII